MNDKYINNKDNNLSGSFPSKNPKDIKKKSGILMAVLPLAACGGGSSGGGGAVTVAPPAPPAPPTPDYVESPTNSFVASSNVNPTLDKASSTADITVTGNNTNDTITTGSGDDTIDAKNGANIIKSGSGTDTITTGSGADKIRAGEGVDSVSSGGGNDVIVVVGTTTATQYTATSITNSAGSGTDLSGLITLADLNGRTVSEIGAGETIDGGTGSNTLVIYGTVDLTGVILTNVATLYVNSDVTLTPAQIAGFTTIDGDGNSVINIVVPSGSPDTYIFDLSTTTTTGIGKINITGDVTVKISDISQLKALGGYYNFVYSDNSNITLNIVDNGSDLAFNLWEVGVYFGKINEIILDDQVTLYVDMDYPGEIYRILNDGLAKISGSGNIKREWSVTSEILSEVTISPAIKNDPQGSVTISGTATEDEVITASNTLADGDGLGAISYQWTRSGTNIDGATSGTYTLVQADVGALIRVVASYTDGQGTAETSTSAATSAVASVIVSGTVVDGYIAGATVFIDENANGILDAGEVSTKSDASGDWSLEQREGQIISIGGTDVSTGASLEGMFLTAPSGSTVITPMTTLIHNFSGQVSQLKVKLGIDESIDINTYDPISVLLLDPDNVIANEFLQVNQQILSIAMAIGSLAEGGDSSLTTAEAFSAVINAIATEGATEQLDLTDKFTIASIIDTVDVSDNIDAEITDAAAYAVAEVNQIIKDASGGLDDVSLAAALLGQTELASDLKDLGGGTILAVDFGDKYTADNIQNTVDENKEIIPDSLVTLNDIIIGFDGGYGEQNIAKKVSVLDNDQSLSDKELSLVSAELAVSSAEYASISFDINTGIVTITPLTEYFGNINFSYTVQNSSGEITVGSGSIAFDSSATFIENSPNTFESLNDFPARLYEADNTNDLIVNGKDGNENITTGSGNDVINGNDGADYIDGGAGADIINGGFGTDIFIFDYADTYDGGTDYDTLIINNTGGNLDASTINGINLDILQINAGQELTIDYLDVRNLSNSNFIRIDGEVGSVIHSSDWFYGGWTAFNAVLGAPSKDAPMDAIIYNEYYHYDGSSYTRIQINIEIDNLNGFAAIPDGYFETSDDTYVALDGSSQSAFSMSYSIDNITITGDSGKEFIITGSGHDTFTDIDGGKVVIWTGDGNDIVTGGSGDDSINGGNHADYLDGGEGNDQLSYYGSDAGVTVNLATSTVSGGDAAGDTIMNFEKIRGTNYSDTLIGDDNDNVFDGEEGVDLIFGGGGNDLMKLYQTDESFDFDIYDGGTGEDTLYIQRDLNVPSFALELSDIDVINIEIIGLKNGATLNLTIDDLISVTDSDNTLMIKEFSVDSHVITSTGEGWVQGADQTIDAELYHSYTFEMSTLLVDTDISQTVI